MTSGSSAPLRPRIHSPPLPGFLKCLPAGQSQTVRVGHARGVALPDPVSTGRVPPSVEGYGVEARACQAITAAMAASIIFGASGYAFLILKSRAPGHRLSTDPTAACRLAGDGSQPAPMLALCQRSGEWNAAALGRGGATGCLVADAVRRASRFVHLAAAGFAKVIREVSEGEVAAPWPRLRNGLPSAACERRASRRRGEAECHHARGHGHRASREQPGIGDPSCRLCAR